MEHITIDKDIHNGIYRGVWREREKENRLVMIVKYYSKKESACL